MNKPYLIQRMRFRKGPEKNPSFDQLLLMEYMGSSDFEWGALPKALKILCKAADELEVVKVKPPIKRFDGAGMFMICKSSEVSYMETIHDLVSEKTKTEGYTNLGQMVKGKNIFGEPIGMDDLGSTHAWWDIEANVIFCFGKKETENILLAILQTRENKKAENQEGWF